MGGHVEILLRKTPSCVIASFAAQPRCLSRDTAYGSSPGTDELYLQDRRQGNSEASLRVNFNKVGYFAVKHQ